MGRCACLLPFGKEVAGNGHCCLLPPFACSSLPCMSHSFPATVHSSAASLSWVCASCWKREHAGIGRAVPLRTTLHPYLKRFPAANSCSQRFQCVRQQPAQPQSEAGTAATDSPWAAHLCDAGRSCAIYRWNFVMGSPFPRDLPPYAALLTSPIAMVDPVARRRRVFHVLFTTEIRLQI